MDITTAPTGASPSCGHLPVGIFPQVPLTYGKIRGDFQLSGNSSTWFCVRLRVQRGENKAERSQPSVLGWPRSQQPAQGKPQAGQTLCKATEGVRGVNLFSRSVWG